MPAGRDPVPAEKIAFISSWINDGCPEDAGPIGPTGEGQRGEEK
jgi:hypothetical protein